MPIYEYRCSSCGHELEALQKLSDAPLSTCPSCSTDGLVKLISAAGFQLKGSGWYATDFRSNGKQPSKPSDDAKSGESKSETNSDTKSDTKSEAATSTPCGSNCACH
jgi:putative FmdB family regulatory protein